MSAAPILNYFRDGQQIGSAPVEGDIVLGREEGCVIRLEDRAISRQHAVFRAVTGGVQVERKSQFAPLSVNGAECTRAVVKEGDVVSIGPFQLRLAPMPSGQASAGAPGKLNHPAAHADREVPSVSALSAQPVDPILGSQASVGETAILAADSADELNLENAEGLALDAPDDAEKEAPQEGISLPGVSSGNAAAALPVTILESPSSGGEASPLDAGGDIVLDPPPELIGEDEATRLAPPALTAAVISVEPGGANVTDLPMGEGEIAIGRGKECEIVLATKKASRKHAVIRREGARFIVRDMDSANGTYVNGRRVKEADLTGDDEIRIGGTRIRFKVENPEYRKREAGFMKVEPSLEPLEAVSEDADTKPLGIDISQPSLSNGGVSNSGVNLTPYSPPTPFAANTQPNLMGLPGASPIPGLSPIKPAPKGFIERYRNMPPKQKAIWTVFIIVFVWWFLFDDEVEVTPSKKKPAAVAPTGQAAPAVENATMDGKLKKLTDKDRAFIEAQHQLAFDHLKNKDYDLCLHELEKIFAIVDNYKDSRELERYAREGKRRRDAIEEEKKKREDEARLKAQVAQLLDEASVRMQKKQYEQATQLFYEILSIEPDNPKVAEWKKVIEAWEEEKARAETERQVQAQINERAYQVLDEGLALKKAGKCRSAIPVLSSVKDIGATDKKVVSRANAAIQSCRSSIVAKRDPLLAQAREKEAAGELKPAFNFYRDATRVDPDHPEGFKGMARIRGTLRERARLSYAEAVMSESYSDFDTARAKYNEVMAIAPEDDLYYERAKRKLSGYLSREPAADPNAGGPR